MSAAEKIDFEVGLKDDADTLKRVNVVLSPDAARRLQMIQDKIVPSTQKEAISKSLHLLETLLIAQENGTKIFLQNKDSKELVEFRMC